jgi:hypothetical protein
MNESHTTAYVNNSFTFFSSWCITSNFSSIPIVLHLFFTGIALGDVDLHFSLMLVKKSYAVKEENR